MFALFNLFLYTLMLAFKNSSVILNSESTVARGTQKNKTASQHWPGLPIQDKRTVTVTRTSVT